MTNEEVPPPPPPAKKTRTRKKVEPKAADPAEPGSTKRIEEGVTPPTAPPKRSRKKKTVDEAGTTVNMEVKTSPESTDLVPQAPTEASADTPPPIGAQHQSNLITYFFLGGGLSRVSCFPAFGTPGMTQMSQIRDPLRMRKSWLVSQMVWSREKFSSGSSKSHARASIVWSFSPSKSEAIYAG